MAVAVECIFTGYWLADLCSQEQIPFVLGHALYMKALHGGKAKNCALLRCGHQCRFTVAMAIEPR
jgi:hypothetical protein